MKVAKTSVKVPTCCIRRRWSWRKCTNWSKKARAKAREPHQGVQGRFVRLDRHWNFVGRYYVTAELFHAFDLN